MKTHAEYVKEPQITTQILKAILDQLLERGISLQKTLDLVGLKWPQIQDPDAKIPLKKYISFYEKAAEQVQDPYLSLHLCLGVGPESIGAVGYLVMSSPTLYEALCSLALYVRAIQDSSEMKVFEEDGLAGISYRITDSDIWPRRQDAEYSIGITYQLIHSYLSGRFELVEIHFEHEKPSKSMALENFFRCPVYYSQPVNAIHFDPKYLQRSSNNADRSLFPILENYVKRSMDNMQLGNQSFLEQLDITLTNHLLEQGATAEKIAVSMGISPATLHRKMRASGISLKDFIDRKRNVLAKNHLLYSDLTIRDIAFKVGFSENAPFTRAFRRWNGIPPEQYRNENASTITSLL
ncbi:AraC family transcriptional regulator [Kordiimonas pumila]|uniref:AraC family transcriptional regulator n=1 Tax=Kordiimonas pumila TaxID=2161677 RepID=A0ABV7D474_9PROT|nr:AraC family transcriptional regulator [Kordiimonas pumila]